jgi:hypothetical protein
MRADDAHGGYRNENENIGFSEHLVEYKEQQAGQEQDEWQFPVVVVFVTMAHRQCTEKQRQHDKRPFNARVFKRFNPKEG